MKGETEPEPGIYFGGRFKFVTKIAWFNVVGFLILHTAALYGMYLTLLDFYHLRFAFFFYSYMVGLSSGEGVTIGAHRLWAHKAFKARLPLRVLLIILHSMAGQNSCYTWVREHRTHHKFTDTNADPHNTDRGLFFSHMGWLMMKRHPDVIRMGKTVDMSDLEADPVLMFQKRYYPIMFLTFGCFLPSWIPYYYMGESLEKVFFMTFVFRYVLLLHFTWTVNSLAHFYGYRKFDKYIKPTENWFVSLTTLGEGWHNYHHVFPWDYRASEYGRYLNVTRYIIDVLAMLGLAYDLRSANDDMVDRRIARTGIKSKLTEAEHFESEDIDDTTRHYEQLKRNLNKDKDIHHLTKNRPPTELGRGR